MNLLEKPIEPLEGVQNVLNKLNGRYKLAVATKDDFLDQERKLTGQVFSSHRDHVG